MSRNPIRSAAEKEWIVEQCVLGLLTHAEAGALIGVDASSVRAWVERYEAEGAAGLTPAARNRTYSPELKRRAVEDYLSGGGTQQDICRRYQIRSCRQLRDWIKTYRADPAYSLEGVQRKTAVKTNPDERLRIARECLASGCDYAGTAERNGVSYQQVYQWVRKLRQHGEPALADHRGRPRKGSG